MATEKYMLVLNGSGSYLSSSFFEPPMLDIDDCDTNIDFWSHSLTFLKPACFCRTDRTPNLEEVDTKPEVLHKCERKIT